MSDYECDDIMYDGKFNIIITDKFYNQFPHDYDFTNGENFHAKLTYKSRIVPTYSGFFACIGDRLIVKRSDMKLFEFKLHVRQHVKNEIPVILLHLLKEFLHEKKITMGSSTLAPTNA